jgi:large subunit ribosomal protein L3
MSLGLVGKKCGMTRVFTEQGVSIPVTVVEVIPNRVTQIKTAENEGYSAVQITAGKKRASHVIKPLAGHFAKAGVEPGNTIKEFRLDEKDAAEKKVGDQITVELFEAGQMVDVRGISKGKGFAGVVKRHNFSTQNKTHGNSLTYRAPGSTGQCQTPGRVFKGKKMAGQMGNVNCVVQSQEIVRVDVDRNLLLIRGAIPGAPGGTVIITQSVKGKASKKAGSK